MTAKERKQLAREMAEELHKLSDEVLTRRQVSERYGWSMSYIEKHSAELGGKKFMGKWFFSKNNLSALISKA